MGHPPKGRESTIATRHPAPPDGMLLRMRPIQFQLQSGRISGSSIAPVVEKWLLREKSILWPHLRPFLSLPKPFPLYLTLSIGSDGKPTSAVALVRAASLVLALSKVTATSFRA